MFDIQFLSDIRTWELEFASRNIQPGAKILEFGAGVGTQARDLKAAGFEVIAIELSNSYYSQDRVFPIIDYDGHIIPLPDQSVDVIFSSNVLEHVHDLTQSLAEFHRVLRRDGYCVHLMPSVSWRIWTFCTGIPTAVIAFGAVIRDIMKPPPSGRLAAFRRNLKTIAVGLLPLGHGASIEGVSELWTFSIFAWRSKFRTAGFMVDAVEPVGLFHTGHMLLGRRIPIPIRMQLSKCLGSAANLYVVSPLIQENL